MTIAYNNSLPNPPDAPRLDIGGMQANTAAIASIIAVDHVGFNSAGSGPPNGGGGHHLQVTFDSKNAPAGLTDPVSILFTANGVASAISQLTYNNALGSFPINTIRAWAYCSSTAVIASQQFNVQTVAGGPSVYNITLVSNAVTTINFAVLVTPGQGAAGSTWAPSVVNTGTGTFTISFIKVGGGSATGPSNFSFQVMQV